MLDGPTSSCLTVEEALAVVERTLAAVHRSRVLAHLDRCGQCRELVDFAMDQTGGGEHERVDHAAALQLHTGRWADRYQVRRWIGSGAMGAVYEAHDELLDRPVALKIFREIDIDPERALGHLVAESRSMAKLRHPNIVSVYDVGLCCESAYVAMEYVDGSTLNRWLSEDAHTVDEVLAILEQAGQGLAAIHAAGLLHRDFKPDNVLVDRENHVRVTDFGLASTMNPGDEPPRTWEIGSAAHPYVAPEATCLDRFDVRSDIFSYCAVAGQALAGRRGVPYRVREVIERGTSKDASERPDSIAAVLAVLRPRKPPWRRPLVVVGALGLTAMGVRYGYEELETRRRCDPTGLVQAIGSTQSLANALEVPPFALSRHAVNRATEKLSSTLADWTEAHRQVCLTVARSPAAKQAREQLACLQHQRNYLAGTFELLAPPAGASNDPIGRERALELVERVPVAEDCLTGPRGHIRRLPDDPQTAAAVLALRDDFARIDPLIGVTRSNDSALQRLEALHDRMEDISYPSVRAEYFWRVALARYNLGRVNEAIESLELGYQAALVAEDRSLLFDITTKQGAFLFETGHLEDARRWLDRASALISDDVPPASRAGYLHKRSVVALQDNDWEQAHRLQREAVGLAREVGSPLHPLVLKMEADLAKILDRRKPSEALALRRSLLERQIERFGEGDIGVAEVTTEIGVSYSFIGDTERALEYLERAQSIPGRPPVRRMFTYLWIAQARTQRHEEQAAIDAIDRALAELAKIGPNDSYEAFARSIRAQAYLGLKQHDRALSDIERAYAIFAGGLGPTSNLTIVTRCSRAQIALERGDIEFAREELVSLADLADRVLDEADVVRLEVFEVLAAAERGLGNYDAAVEAASRALGQCERFECQVPLWGDLQLELALALHERGDAFASARAAAEKADRIYARLPGEPHSIRQRAKIAQTFARGTSG